MWFKVCDGLHDHRKVRRAGTAAMGLWALAGSWCAANLTDGFVPEVVAQRYGTARQTERLVTAGLWEPTVRDGEPGWLFHDWFAYQPSREQVERKRSLASQRQAKSRAVRTDQHRSTGSVTRNTRVSHDVSHASPDPTRPDSSPYVSRAGSGSVPRETPTAATPVTSTSDSVSPTPSPSEVRVAIGLVAEHVPAQPRKVAHRLAQEASRLLAEGITGEQVAAGLRLWSTKRVGAGLLAELVGEAMRGPAIAHAAGARSRSTTDERVAAALTLAQRYDLEDTQARPQRPAALLPAGAA